jgi:hypothetical protein
VGGGGWFCYIEIIYSLFILFILLGGVLYKRPSLSFRDSTVYNLWLAAATSYKESLPLAKQY